MADPWGIFYAGQTRRWHANPHMCHVVESSREHAGKVAALIIDMWPFASRDLVSAAIMHDDGEQSAWGDVPATAKANMSLEARAEMERAEAKGIIKLWGREIILPRGDAKMLKLADRLDPYMMMLRWRPDIADKYQWPEAREWLRGNAIALGVADKVAGVVG